MRPRRIAETAWARNPPDAAHGHAEARAAQRRGVHVRERLVLGEVLEADDDPRAGAPARPVAAEPVGVDELAADRLGQAAVDDLLVERRAAAASRAAGTRRSAAGAAPGRSASAATCARPGRRGRRRPCACRRAAPGGRGARAAGWRRTPPRPPPARRRAPRSRRRRPSISPGSRRGRGDRRARNPGTQFGLLTQSPGAASRTGGDCACAEAQNTASNAAATRATRNMGATLARRSSDPQTVAVLRRSASRGPPARRLQPGERRHAPRPVAAQPRACDEPCMPPLRPVGSRTIGLPR